jgi:amino acid transporter
LALSNFRTVFTNKTSDIIVTPNNLTAASLVLQYWVKREKVNPGAFIAVFLVAVVIINYFGVRFFGEFEFWLR